MSAGGCCCLNSACKFWFVSSLNHHRDGDRTGRNRITNGRTRNHTTQSRRNNGYFCRAPYGRTCHTVCQINEKCGNAGSLQERSENDKYDDVLLTYVNWGVHHTIGGVEQIVNNFTKTNISKSIDQKCANHEKDRKSHASSAKLDQYQDRYDSDSQHKWILRNDTVAGQQNLLGVVSKVKEWSRACDHQHDVIPWNIVDPHMAFLHRIVQKSNEDDHG